MGSALKDSRIFPMWILISAASFIVCQANDFDYPQVRSCTVQEGSICTERPKFMIFLAHIFYICQIATFLHQNQTMTRAFDLVYCSVLRLVGPHGTKTAPEGA